MAAINNQINPIRNILLNEAKLDRRNTVSNIQLRMNLIVEFERIIAHFGDQLSSRLPTKLEQHIARILVHRAAEEKFSEIFGKLSDNIGVGAKFAATHFDSVASLSSIENTPDFIEYKEEMEASLNNLIRNRKNMEKHPILDPTKSSFFIPALSRNDLHLIIDLWEGIDDWTLSVVPKGGKDADAPSQTHAFLRANSFQKITKEMFTQRKKAIISAVRGSLPLISNRGTVISLTQLATIIENVLREDEYLIPATARSILKESSILVMSTNINMVSVNAVDGVFFERSAKEILERIEMRVTKTMDDEVHISTLLVLLSSWAFDSKTVWDNVSSESELRSSPIDRFICPLPLHSLFEAFRPALRRAYKAYIPTQPDFAFLRFLTEIGSRSAGSGELLEKFEHSFSLAIREDMRTINSHIENWRKEIESIDLSAAIDGSLDKSGWSQPALMERTSEARYRIVTDMHEFRTSPIVKIECDRRLLPYEKLTAGAQGFNDAVVVRSNALCGAAVVANDFSTITPFFELFSELEETTGEKVTISFNLRRIFNTMIDRVQRRKPNLPRYHDQTSLMVKDLIEGVDLEIPENYEVASAYTETTEYTVLAQLLELQEVKDVFIVGDEHFCVGLVSGKNPINMDRAKHRALHNLIRERVGAHIFVTTQVTDKVVFDYKEENVSYFKRISRMLDSDVNPYQDYTFSPFFVNLINNRFALKQLGTSVDAKVLRDIDMYKLQIHDAANASIDAYMDHLTKYLNEFLNENGVAFKLFGDIIKGNTSEAIRQRLREPRNSRVIQMILSLLLNPITKGGDLASPYLTLVYLDKLAIALSKGD